MDALAVVANVGLQNEVYALRKRCFLPPFLTLDHAFWKELQEAHDDGEVVNSSPGTLAAAIMEYSYEHSPRDTLTRLATVCDTHGLPVPGDWAMCEQEVNHVVQFHPVSMFGDIGQASCYWNDHRKLFLYLGLFRDGAEYQDHLHMEGKTWTDAIFEHPGLRARQLVNVLNAMSVHYTYSDWVWEEEEWPFTMDAEINPTSDSPLA